MMNTRAVRAWRQMLANQGLAATFRVAKHRIFQYFWPNAKTKHQVDAAPTAAPVHDGLAIHPFDRQYGVDTSGLIWGEDLVSGSRNDRWSTAYYGVPPSVFHAVLGELRDSIPGASFVDIGAGKGRAVMLAAQLPFDEVLGVELSPELHAVAETNLAAFRAKVPVDATVRLLSMDAVEFDFPAQPLVLFFYHPFCKPVMKAVLRRLEQSLRAHPRPAHIVYINTELREVLEGTPYLTKVFAQTLAMGEEDQLADRAGSTVEACAIYRSTIG